MVLFSDLAIAFLYIVLLFFHGVGVSSGGIILAFQLYVTKIKHSIETVDHGKEAFKQGTPRARLKHGQAAALCLSSKPLPVQPFRACFRAQLIFSSFSDASPTRQHVGEEYLFLGLYEEDCLDLPCSISHFWAGEQRGKNAIAFDDEGSFRIDMIGYDDLDSRGDHFTDCDESVAQALRGEVPDTGCLLEKV